MDDADFRSYRFRIRELFGRALAAAEPRRLDEATFPAYCHPNPLVGWLFWQRLRVVMELVERHGPCERALDFGCGGGAMLPFLARNARSVTGLDVDLAPFQAVRELLGLPASVEVRGSGAATLAELPPASFGIVLALDVLEHVDDLPAVLRELARLLQPGGLLVVSGPTENAFYRLGRRLAGPEYSGSYHVRGVAEVEAELRRVLPVETVARLYPPVVLFRVLVGRAGGRAEEENRDRN